MSFEDWLEETDEEIAELQERNRKIIEAKKAEVAKRVAEYKKSEQEITYDNTGKSKTV